MDLAGASVRIVSEGVKVRRLDSSLLVRDSRSVHFLISSSSVEVEVLTVYRSKEQ